jgi:hypothetical protein
MKKLLRISEPRRTSKWIRMSFVACNGNIETFERLYMSYHSVFEPIASQDTVEQVVKPTNDHEKSQEEQIHEKQPQKERLPEKDSQEKPAEKQQSQDAHSQETRSKGPLTRLEFLTIFSNAIHGILVYTPQSRVRSWRGEGEPHFSKLVVVGVCPRTKALTFPSASFNTTKITTKSYTPRATRKRCRHSRNGWRMIRSSCCQRTPNRRCTNDKCGTRHTTMAKPPRILLSQVSV